MMIGIINAHMIAAETVPGEHVDWSSPDVHTASEWQDILGVPVEQYAAENDHMIVFIT